VGKSQQQIGYVVLSRDPYPADDLVPTMWEQAQQQDFSSRAGDILSIELSLERGHIPASKYGRNLTVEHY